MDREEPEQPRDEAGREPPSIEVFYADGQWYQYTPDPDWLREPVPAFEPRVWTDPVIPHWTWPWPLGTADTPPGIQLVTGV